MIIIRKQVIKKASYWLYCPQCRELQPLEHVIEKPITPVCSILFCHCGHRFSGIEKEWTLFEEHPYFLDIDLAKATKK